MSEQAKDKEQEITNEQDNMSQNSDLNEEALATEQNIGDNQPGTQHLNDEMETEDEKEKLRMQLDEANDKYLRMVAEFENFRKRNAKERIELIMTAGRDIVQSLLEVLDDSERAEKQLATASDVETAKEGVGLVFNKLRHILQQKGLKKMESIGHEFNSDLHEAITEIPAPNDDMKGKVMDEVEPGYYLNDKLIRHAKVVVGK